MNSDLEASIVPTSQDTFSLQKHHVAIPSDYFFKMATKEYCNWPLALAREFIQNSVDAGATEINISVENGWVTIDDNGCGMSYDRIVNALLTLGGTQKDSETAVGGFGKAKELLYFSWPKWYIHSRDILVSGEGSQYTLETASFRNGTVSRCYLGEDKAEKFTLCVFTYVRRCLRVIGRTIRVNGNSISHLSVDPTSLQSKGKIEGLGELFLKSETLGEILNPQETSFLNPGVYVLINGLFMFVSRVVDRQVYFLQLAGRGYDLLTANRDGFTYTAQSLFDPVIKRLAVDPLSANFEQRWTALIARPRNFSTASKIIPLESDHSVNRGTSTYTPSSVASSSSSQVLEGWLDKEHIKVQLVDPTHTPIYSDILSDYNSLFEEGWMFLSTKPFTKKDLLFFKSRFAKHLSLLWKAVVDHVADRNRINQDYGLGFVYAPTVEAAYFNGFILFNPTKVDKMTNNECVIKMITSAAEELTHYLGYVYHDEAFKCRYTNLLEKSLSSLTNHRDFVRYANWKITSLS